MYYHNGKGIYNLFVVLFSEVHYACATGMYAGWDGCSDSTNVHMQVGMAAVKGVYKNWWSTWKISTLPPEDQVANGYRGSKVMS